ncbi:MAG TPA: type II toxin-antitoxin system HicA family toxin [Nitrospirae bacterium]|nr:type II toxin-antitoxin system HicA family toxin [Nitrospirota bacterium]
MGQRQPRVTADEILRVSRSLGFEKVDQSGSHQKWKHPLTGKQTIVILSLMRNNQAQNIQEDS